MEVNTKQVGRNGKEIMISKSYQTSKNKIKEMLSPRDHLK